MSRLSLLLLFPAGTSGKQAHSTRRARSACRSRGGVVSAVRISGTGHRSHSLLGGHRHRVIKGASVTRLIEDYALLGDTQTAALVSRAGSIDWLCFPRFDSGAVFAALLGTEQHGRWSLAPTGEVTAVRRRYSGDTLILETEIDTADGTIRLIDFMPPRGQAPDVVRIVAGVSGRVTVRMELRLRFDYGQVVPWVRQDADALVAVAGPDSCWLRTPVDTHGEEMMTVAEFIVEPGDRVPFVLTWLESHLSAPQVVDAEVALQETREYWTQWVSKCS
ncbi:MAG: trehalase-like domain-containing protein, partial [Nakamurella sp.]